MSEERLMKTPEEVRQKARELLQMPKEEVLTKYMFQEQKIERLHSIIKELKEYIEQYDLEGVKLDSEYFYDCLIELTEILDKENK